jgi:peroxiredoxin
MPETDATVLPPDLPVPVDDGTARHLPGMRLPPIPLQGTDDRKVSLADLPGRIVVYVYPQMGVPGIAMPPGWDLIPGARGCTAETCGFRDHAAELEAAGAAGLYGVSSQSTEEQREAVDRLRLPFPLLSDPWLELAERMGLPTFAVAGVRRYRRLTMILRDGVVEATFYPVFPPDGHAAEVVEWLGGEPGPVA